MADGLLGTLLGGAKNIGTGLMNIPTNIGQRYEAGELFGGGGALGGLLGQEARKQAQDEAIMKMGLSLLGQGPSRTPISFGQSLAQGLLQGQQAYRQDLQGQLADTASLLSLGKAKDPNYVKMNIGGDDVLVDTNPRSPTFQQVISPQTGVSDAASVKPVQIIPTESEIKNAPLPEDVAQGDLYGAMARGVRGVAGIFGKEASKETTRAEYFVENLNKDLRLNLVQDLGGRLTKVVSDELNKILPNPLQDNNTEFIVKAEELVDFSEKRIAEINSQLPNMTSKEKKEAVNLVNNLSSKIRSYKAMLEKQRQFDTSSGIYAKEQESTEALMDEAASLLGGNQ
jgi:hypothetical protein